MTDAEFLKWLQSQDAVKLILVEVQDVLVNGVPTPMYFSNRTFISSPTDSPSNTVYDPCISGGVTFSESLALDGSASVGFGDIELINLDGSKDDLLSYGWVNRSVSVYVGDPRFSKLDFRLIFSGQIENLYSRSSSTLNMVIVDKLPKLAVPVATALVPAGDGEVIPLTFGECFNVPAVLLNPAELEYSVHDSAIEGIIEVRDNGYPVSVVKSLTNGTFKLTQASYGKITASVQGSSLPSYSNNIAEIITRIISNYGPESSRLSLDIDYANFSEFATSNTQPVGIFINSEMTKLDVCQNLASSVGATLTCNSQGKLKLVKLDLPVSTYKEVYSSDMVKDSLQIADKASVKASVRLNYCINWSPHEDDLASGIAPSTVSVFKSKWYNIASKNTSVANTYDLPDTVVSEDTLLLTQADADNEADRQLALWSTQRYIYSAVYFPHLMLTELADGVKIHSDRFGLSEGKVGTVVRIERDWFNSRITLGVLI
jgi:hypothetical protein